MNDWGGYYTKRMKAVLTKEWASGDTWGGFAEGMLTMAPFRNMPDDVAALAKSTVADIKSGKNKIFTGPLTDQTGKVFLAAGQTMDDGTLSGMQTLIAGIEGKLT
ncbi:MAG: hypothetical protein POG24_00970 [Acidocella sp.]|nr:hypothetical protein [Acidocella sp.]